MSGIGMNAETVVAMTKGEVGSVADLLFWNEGMWDIKLLVNPLTGLKEN